MTTPLHKYPCTGGHKIYNFGISFLGHHFYTLSLHGPCPEDILKYIILHVYPKITSLWGVGSSNLSSYPTHAT